MWPRRQRFQICSMEVLPNATSRFSASSDFADIKGLDAIVICVPTPLKNGREPDLGPVLSTGSAIAAHLRKGQLVVLESSPRLP